VLAARQKLADRLSLVETVVGEKRAAAERLAVAGATDAKLGRAEAKLRAVEERAKTLRAELVEFDEQIASTERALADAEAQRDRDMVADQIEAMAAAIEQAAPGLVPVPPGSWTPSQKARRQCWRRPGSRPA
jgi:septal ring factor EnvC (AmiA/AmiB activator)